jgi:hypothetical protein
MEPEPIILVGLIPVIGEQHIMVGPTQHDAPGRLQAIRPSVKVLLVSGYETSDIAPSGRPFSRRS